MPLEGLADDVANLLVRVYEIHEVIINETGGLPGLREATLLHSAVARPFSTFGGRELYPTDYEKAAALFHSLIKSHPFMDGTKRTAFAAALFFLQASGHRIPAKVPLNEVIDFCVAIADENSDEARDQTLPQERWLKSVIGSRDWYKETSHPSDITIHAHRASLFAF